MRLRIQTVYVLWICFKGLVVLLSDEAYSACPFCVGGKHVGEERAGFLAS